MRRKIKKILQLSYSYPHIPEISNNIGIIIPTTSNKRNYQNVQDIDFFKIVFSSFIKCMNKDKKYNYNFYLGYDYDDQFYLQNHQKIIDYFNSFGQQNLLINLYKVENMKGKVGQIWSFLADKAKEKNHFLYQLGDDIELIDSGWEDIFIQNLDKSNYLGVTGPLDLNNVRLLTQSFVHIIHLDVFGTYFPPEIINWFIDDWIMNVYSSTQDRRIKLINKGGVNRYNAINDKANYLKILKRDKTKLEKYLI